MIEKNIVNKKSNREKPHPDIIIADQPRKVPFKVYKDGPEAGNVINNLSAKETIEILTSATGSQSYGVGVHLALQASYAHADKNQSPADALNNAIGMLSGIDPQTQEEGMLATQMVAIHNMMMEVSRRTLVKGQSTDGVTENINRAVKLSRVFTAQLDALQKLRGESGKQKMTIEHVHVNEGGQAVIGTVEAVGSGRGKSEN